MYNLKEWVLSVPKVLNIDEHKLWSDWKKRMNTIYSLDDSFIKLKNGNELIDLMKKYDLYRIIFKIDELNILQDNKTELNKANTKLDRIEKNIYSEMHNEMQEQEMLIEIFNKAIARGKTISKEEKERLSTKDSEVWIHTENKKIPLNFKKNKEQNEVKEYFRLSLLKQGLMREIFESYDSYEQDEISLTLLFDYNKLKEEYNSIQVLRKLIDIYMLKNNKNYQSLAIAFVLTFFEDCTIFEKTEEEQNPIQTSLF